MGQLTFGCRTHCCYNRRRRFAGSQCLRFLLLRSICEQGSRSKAGRPSANLRGLRSCGHRGAPTGGAHPATALRHMDVVSDQEMEFGDTQQVLVLVADPAHYRYAADPSWPSKLESRWAAVGDSVVRLRRRDKPFDELSAGRGWRLHGVVPVTWKRVENLERRRMLKPQDRPRQPNLHDGCCCMWVSACVLGSRGQTCQL